jgi:hypothetical protein
MAALLVGGHGKLSEPAIISVAKSLDDRIDKMG